MTPIPITPEAVKAELLRLAEQGNKPFTESLNPGVPNVLGIRIPHLRELAKKIAKGDWQAYLATADTYYMEERMLQGMVLGSIRPDGDVEVYLGRVTRFVRLINSWSVCDTVCSTQTFARRHPEEVWRFLTPYFTAPDEYAVRFAVVMTLCHFVGEARLDEIFARFDAIRHEGYYVKMAVAWAVSVCFVKCPVPTERYLAANRLDDFTQNKAIQKIRESFRVTPADKQRLLAYRRG